MMSEQATMTARFFSRIEDIEASAWDALRCDDNPFVSHAFLQALEDTGCIQPDYGWQPHHLGLYEGDHLVAAAPLYLKGNSHGEFVFDFSWASAWERAGGEYYPKLLNAVPYSPVPGPRLLAGENDRTPTLQRSLVDAMQAETERLGLSSAHANFLLDGAADAFGDQWLTRTDIQYHWHNHDYRHFPQFLAELTHKKRKNILHERRQAQASGLLIEWRSGDSLSDAQWLQIHALYANTFDEKGNHAALTAAFFRQLGKLGQTAQVALARDGDDILAMALFLRSDSVLYGRYWGTRTDLPGLHFELCYYQGIDYAIGQQLQRFEPGAQGRHKMARGFLPAITHSRHYLAHEGFREAVQKALEHEAAEMAAYRESLNAHSPYAQK